MKTEKEPAREHDVLLNQCRECLAVRVLPKQKTKKEFWQNTFVTFQHLPKTICFTCQKKNEAASRHLKM